MRGLRLTVGTVGCVTAYVALLVVDRVAPERHLLAWGLVPWWGVCLGLTWWVTRRELDWRRPVLAIMVSAALVQLPGVVTPPRTSGDSYRYAWDGRVQLSGTSPYRYVPFDDRLASLRDPVLFPGLTSAQRSGVVTEALPRDRTALLARAADDPRTRINRPQVPTIYPPVAEAWFAAVALVTPWSWGTLGLQIGSALLAVAIAGFLAAWFRRRGGRPVDALWWAWCPVVLLEVGNGAHVDIVGAVFILGAVVLAATRAGRRWTRALTGVLLGLAASVKLTPLVMVPAYMSSRRGWRSMLPTPVTAVLTVAATYLPHVLVAGWLVVGYLPGYLSEESGVNQAGILAFVLPQAWRQAGVVAVMVVAVAWAVVRAREEPAVVALTLFGVLLLAATPSYPWYTVPLVALAVLTRRLEWIAVALAGHLALALVLFAPWPAVGYAVAAIVVVGADVRRRRRTLVPA